MVEPIIMNYLSIVRIVPVLKSDGRTNHHELFIDRADQLRSLECSIVYTVPISLVHSSGINDLSSVYDSGSTKILPMIMVRDRKGKINQEGLQQMQNIIRERMKKCAPDLQLVPDIFVDRELIDNICVMTGGYVRALMLLIQSLINEIDCLPITEAAARRCFSYLRNERHIAIEEKYEILARTAISKEVRSDNDHRKLLFNRCILHYAYVDADNQTQYWYDIDPLIVGIPQFQAAMKKIESKN